MAEASNESRRSGRKKVILVAEIEHEDQSYQVTIGNLSPGGALVNGDRFPPEGSSVVFRRNSIAKASRIAWVDGAHAGLEFEEPLQVEELLRPLSKPRIFTSPRFRRSPLKS